MATVVAAPQAPILPEDEVTYKLHFAFKPSKSIQSVLIRANKVRLLPLRLRNNLLKGHPSIGSKGDFTSVPTIDISNIDSPSLDARKEISKEIYAACTTTGFFYLENHGLPEELLKETFDAIKRFFALDLDVKMEAHIHKNPAICGYEPLFETKFDPRTQGGTYILNRL